MKLCLGVVSIDRVTVHFFIQRHMLTCGEKANSLMTNEQRILKKRAAIANLHFLWLFSDIAKRKGNARWAGMRRGQRDSPHGRGGNGW